MTHHTDAHGYVALIERTRAGSLDAFGELVERFQDMVVGDAWAQLGDLTDAVDVAQDVFLDALRKLELLRDPSAFPSWLRMIVATHCARMRRGRRPTPVDTTVTEPGPTTRDPSAPSPEDEVIDRDRIDRLRNRVEQLPPTERAVIAMHYLGDCTYAEVAAYLGISEAAAKQRANVARARIRDDEEGPMDLEAAMHTKRPSHGRCFATSTLLFAAIAREDVEVARRLLADDPSLADVDAAAFRGATPLHVAAMRGSTGIAQLLRDAGADPDRPDDDGRTPGDWAELKGHDRTVFGGRATDGRAAHPSETLESGIKAINLFAPLYRGGVVRWVGRAGTGSLVVLTELLHDLATLEDLHVEVVGFEHAGLTAAELRHAFLELAADVRADVRLAPAEARADERRRVFADACSTAVTARGAHRATVTVVAAHPEHLADVEVFGMGRACPTERPWS